MLILQHLGYRFDSYPEFMFLKSMIVLDISEVSGGDKDTTVLTLILIQLEVWIQHGETRWINGTIFNLSFFSRLKEKEKKGKKTIQDKKKKIHPPAVQISISSEPLYTLFLQLV